MTNLMQQLWRCERGASVVEYGLILALTTVAIILSLSGIVAGIDQHMSDAQTVVDDHATP